jgi:hypothetical protein
MIHQDPRYDVAISFLVEDLALATALHDKLREGLDVFFFPRNQEELAGSDGLESMREPFANQSLLNIVLYREKWGNTPWTGIEAAAIKDSCLASAFKSLFFFVIHPTKSLPRWLPDTHIRFNYGDFSLEDAVGAIKARVVERGGRYKPMTPIRRAEIFKADEEYRLDRMQMTSTEGLKCVRASVKDLFRRIEDQCQAINEGGDLDIDYGSVFEERKTDQFCVLTHGQVGLQVNWFQRFSNSLEPSGLRLREFSGRLRVPGESMAGVYLQEPELIRETTFAPDISRARDYGWKEEGKEAFIANQVLAARCVTEFIDLVERDAAGEVSRRSLY